MVRALLAVVALAFAHGCASGLGRPENVLVVQNGNSPVSCHVAEYYMSRRGIPASNLVTIYTVDSALSADNEKIAPTDFVPLIRQPILDFLDAHGLTDQIQYIVMTRGVPQRFTNDSSEGLHGGRCVDSMLAATDLIDPIEQRLLYGGVYAGTWTLNRYWMSKEPFRHSKHGGYLVTRLDGYDEDDAKALVDRSLSPQAPPYCVLLDEDPEFGLGSPDLQPKSALLPNGTQNSGYYLSYEDYNADMAHAASVISSRPYVAVQLDQTDTFVLSASPLAGYVSWGSNDHNFDSAAYLAELFAPGGIAETAVSTSARTFFPTTGGQSLITNLIACRTDGEGVVGVKGYVTEPYLDAIASPSVLLDNYTLGRNLAESYYAASRYVGWKDCVIGDPLCALTGVVAATPGEAKSLADGLLVTLEDAMVTAGSAAFADRFYVEDVGRTSGIQVRTDATLSDVTEGTLVTVRGILSTTSGERVITQASVGY